ncbi:hypothetical protein F5887DRAFT_917334 [Amanita rubescens]|nr:hypothetical protein F5887DRAFT_917334 [Amanita rubescens]
MDVSGWFAFQLHILILQWQPMLFQFPALTCCPDANHFIMLSAQSTPINAGPENPSYHDPSEYHVIQIDILKQHAIFVQNFNFMKESSSPSSVRLQGQHQLILCYSISAPVQNQYYHLFKEELLLVQVAFLRHVSMPHLGLLCRSTSTWREITSGALSETAFASKWMAMQMMLVMEKSLIFFKMHRTTTMSLCSVAGGSLDSILLKKLNKLIWHIMAEWVFVGHDYWSVPWPILLLGKSSGAYIHLFAVAPYIMAAGCHGSKRLHFNSTKMTTILIVGIIAYSRLDVAETTKHVLKSYDQNAPIADDLRRAHNLAIALGSSELKGPAKQAQAIKSKLGLVQAQIQKHPMSYAEAVLPVPLHPHLGASPLHPTPLHSNHVPI